jgi:hypothetical protein
MLRQWLREFQNVSLKEIDFPRIFNQVLSNAALTWHEAEKLPFDAEPSDFTQLLHEKYQ